eukprot:GHVU01196515.1.p3 GENE.GHVU01196515.1~~GHVU01196515.1.p3  ORF type:complete len:118 (+),score=22.68 GHVU01196515.1:1120-1473(+)
MCIQEMVVTRQRDEKREETKGIEVDEEYEGDELGNEQGNKNLFFEYHLNTLLLESSANAADYAIQEHDAKSTTSLSPQTDAVSFDQAKTEVDLNGKIKTLAEAGGEEIISTSHEDCE